MALHLIELADGLACPSSFRSAQFAFYPKHTPVPFKESDLWMGIQKKPMHRMGCQRWQPVMLDAYQRQYGLSGAYLLPVNLYGPWDNFDLHTSHVIPALIRKCVEARDSGQDHIECWGTGSASREFLYVEDAAEGVVRATEVLDEPVPVNLGTNMEITIKDLVELIVKLTSFQGEIRWTAPSQTDNPDDAWMFRGRRSDWIGKHRSGLRMGCAHHCLVRRASGRRGFRWRSSVRSGRCAF